MPRFIRLCALAGICGPLFFGAMLAGLTFLKYDFLLSLGWDPLRASTFDWPSGLALGALGGLMTATFILCGAAMSLFSLGLCTQLHTQSGRLGTTLLSLAGLALAGLAFTTDPTLRSTPATWHGKLHDASFILLGLALLPAMIALGFAFRRAPAWRDLSVLTWTAAALALPTFALKGAAFYVFLLAILVWSEALAWRLYKTA